MVRATLYARPFRVSNIMLRRAQGTHNVREVSGVGQRTDSVETERSCAFSDPATGASTYTEGTERR